MNKKELIIGYITDALDNFFERFFDGEPIENLPEKEMTDIESGLFIEALAENDWEDFGVCVYHKDEDGDYGDDFEAYTLQGITMAESFTDVLRYKDDIIADMADRIIADWLN